ncbi:MAG: hypothetical protein K0R29_1814 [Pseudobdellovibrio sp.]|jgi:hypothetical protein|nr:hypothetical protein [Pseudobdellovibrio sp.]
MKLILLIVSIISASLSVQAGASPGAYDKLRKMFDTSGGSVKVADVHAWTNKIKGCASSDKSSPNEISNAAKPVSVSYTSPSFGPDFPSTTLTGIGLSTTSGKISTVSESFFTTYREVAAANELQLNTQTWWDDQNCWDDSDDVTHCYDTVKSAAINLVIRLNSKSLVYKNGETYAYCWQ